MYQIREDKRTQRSARLLKEGLLKCLQTNDLNEIGICDICLASGISRTTFYRLFDTPTDVLAYACDNMAAESVLIYGKKGTKEKKDLVIEFFQLLMDHCELLEAIVKCDRREVLENAFDHYYSEYTKTSLNKADTVEDSYFAAISGSIITAVLFRWAKGGKLETAEGLYDIYRKFIRKEYNRI